MTGQPRAIDYSGYVPQATLASLSATPSVTPSVTPSRKRRCRVLTRLGDRCQSEELSDLGMCMRHLRVAHEEWTRLLNDAMSRHPATVLDDDAD